MSEIHANIKTLQELEFSRLNIPFYQRPYRWQISHVETLLNSIRDNINKKEYRIGSIILHYVNDSEKLDIVDGQQRLTTLSLLFMYLELNTSHRLYCEYNHIESRQNIYRNYRYIIKWVERHNIDKSKLLHFLLERCTVVEIVADDLSEAFQMFDSQNGRGKELEAYNLLKAYHLHAIDNEEGQLLITDEKKEIDRLWESAVLRTTYHDKEPFFKCAQKPLLKYIVNELYRIRQWSKLKPGNPFSKSKLKEFKGIQFNGSESPLPLHNQSLLLYLYFNQTQKASRRSLIDIRDQNPFVSINMEIINGKCFFSYIQTYVSSYEYLFENIIENSQLNLFRKDFDTYCLYYGGASREGDTYIREVYIALIIALYDRFGEEFVSRWYPIFYNLAYRKRLELETVFFSSVTKDKDVAFYFETIALAIDESGLEPLLNSSIKPVDCKRLGDKEKEIAIFMLNHGAELNITKDKLKFGRELKIGETLTKKELGK